MSRLLSPANQNVAICERIETLMMKLEGELARYVNGSFAAVVYPADYTKGSSILRNIGAFRD